VWFDFFFFHTIWDGWSILFTTFIVVNWFIVNIKMYWKPTQTDLAILPPQIQTFFSLCSLVRWSCDEFLASHHRSPFFWPSLLLFRLVLFRQIRVLVFLLIRSCGSADVLSHAFQLQTTICTIHKNILQKN